MRLSRCLFFLILVSTGVVAEDVKIVGSLDQTIITSNYSRRTNVESSVKHISLLKIELSETIKRQLKNNLGNPLKQTGQRLSRDRLINKIQLGMGNVPVLDQGRHSTCVTFAITAAIDAALNNGNNISQLCLLQLGNFLEQNAHIPSGWDGSSFPAVLDEITIFGIMNKQQQREHGCGGLKEYPTQANNAPCTEISPQEYHRFSASLSKKVGWSSVIDQYTRNDNTSFNKKILDVKTALNAKDRVAFGVILVDINLGTVGAVGKFNVANDSWLLSAQIEKDTLDFLNGTNPGLQLGLHAMVITGYDDDAVAFDDEGIQHQGLFTLRNSWGKDAGDHGDYYMSYDYFASFATDAQRIRKAT